MKYVAEEAFLKMTEGKISTQEVQQWLVEEQAMASDEASTFSPLPAWKCEYFQTLHSYYQLRESLNCRQEKLSLYQETIRLDKQLRALEEKHHVKCRWSKFSKDYRDVERLLSKQKSDQVAEAIRMGSSRRQFLLSLKAKYAGTTLFL